MSVTEILEAVRALSPEEREQVKALIASLPSAPEPRHDAHERERAWVDRHRDEYVDQWVALDGDKLLAHGIDARKVYLAARAAGVEVPYVERIKRDGAPPFAGW